MDSSILNNVTFAMTMLEQAKRDLEAEETIGLDADLLRSLLILDERYKEYCLSFDDPKKGYHADFGPNIEFYIEAADWHRISLALRVWKQNNENWPETLNIDIEDMIDL